MKLSDDARQHLMELVIVTGRITDDTAVLVKHGLAYTGEGRFGKYVRATEKGIALAKTWTPAERTLRETNWLNRVTSQPRTDLLASQPHPGSGAWGDKEMQAPSRGKLRGATTRTHRNVAKQAGDVLPSRVSQSPKPPATPLQSGGTSTAVRGSPPARPSGSPVCSAPDHVVRRPKRCTTSGAPSTPLPTPNAVRVRIGAKYTYYPLSSFEAIKHGEKARVNTRCKLYSSVAVASPRALQDVLCE